MKKVVPILLISILALQALHAQADSNPDMGQIGWSEIPPYSFYNHTSNNYEHTNVQMWVGLQASIHF